MLEGVVLKKLERIEGRCGEIEGLLADPAVASDRARYQALAKEHSDLSEVVSAFRDYRDVLGQITEAREIAEGTDDEELVELARLEMAELEERQEALSNRLKTLLIPKDLADERNTIVEIRAGTGGEEAALFAADLFRMYGRYAEEQGWWIELLSSNPTGLGGFKEIIFSVSGRGVYGRLKYESGVHRVQRVPETEASGRIHTSAASVAVLPEAEEIDVQIDPKDLRIDVCRSSGPGGQSVNTTDSAVRVTHLPTGIAVHCQDEKSQHKNKAKALKILRARLLDIARQEQQERIARERRSMVRSGDRSDKVRTYNFPQNRVTDHRINLTLYDLDRVIDGEIDGLIEALRLADQAERLAEVG